MRKVVVVAVLLGVSGLIGAPAVSARASGQIQVEAAGSLGSSTAIMSDDQDRVQPTPSQTYTPFEGAHCPQHHVAALNAGWPVSDLQRLDYIMWRESRCETNAHNRADPQGGSRGLTQINGFWCRRNRYEPNPAGFLGKFEVLSRCEDLFDPETNLLAARVIYTYQVWSGRCGWLPWTTRQTRWC